MRRCVLLHATLKPSFLKLGTCMSRPNFFYLWLYQTLFWNRGVFECKWPPYKRVCLWFNPWIVFVSLERQLSISCLGVSVKFMSFCDIVEKLRSRACELIEKSNSLWESIWSCLCALTSTSQPIPNPQIPVKLLKLWHCELRSVRVRSLVLIDYCISGLQSRNWVADNRSALRESVSRGWVLCWRQSPAHTLECLAQYCWGSTLSFLATLNLVALVLKFESPPGSLRFWKFCSILYFSTPSWSLLNSIVHLSVSEPESEQNFGFPGIQVSALKALMQYVHVFYFRVFLCSISVPSAPPELITKFKAFRKPWRIWNPDLVVFIKVIRIPASWPVKKYQALTCHCMVVLPKFRHLSSWMNFFEYYNFRTEFINLTPFMSANKTSWEFTKPSNIGPYFTLFYFDFLKGLPDTKLEWCLQGWIGKLGIPLTKLAKLSILEGVNGIIKPGR